MGLFPLFGKAKGMDDGVAEARNTQGSFLVDVRESNEFASGHAAGAISLPLSELERVGELVEDRSAPIFLYCASGVRSARAAARLRRKGYTNVRDIGGINDYTGPLKQTCP